MGAIKVVSKSVKHWYLLVVGGILMVGLGVWVILFPHHSVVAAAIVFSLAFLFAGAFEVVFSVSNRKEITGWGWGLTLGILKLAIGLLLFINPNISALTLSLYVGFLVLFHSLIAIVIAFTLKRFLVLRWGNLLALGIVGFFLSFALLLNPGFTALVIVAFLGLALIVSGVTSIYLALKLKKMKALASKVSSDLMSRNRAVEKELEEIFSKGKG